MKKIILETDISTTHIQDIGHKDVIIAKNNNRYRGMIIKEEKGYILRFPDGSGSDGHHNTLRECLESNINQYRYQFFVL